jgi:hypothetical protein
MASRKSFLSVAFEGKGEVAQAASGNDGNPTNPHWRIPAANHNWPSHIKSQGL